MTIFDYPDKKVDMHLVKNILKSDSIIKKMILFKKNISFNIFFIKYIILKTIFRSILDKNRIYFCGGKKL